MCAGLRSGSRALVRCCGSARPLVPPHLPVASVPPPRVLAAPSAARQHHSAGPGPAFFAGRAAAAASAAAAYLLAAPLAVAAPPPAPAARPAVAGSSQEDAWFPGLGLLWGDARTLFSDPSRRGTDQLLALTAAAGGLQVLTRGRVTQAGLLDGAAVARGQVWRLGTAVLLHGGLVHFAWNAVALNVLGPQLERWVGTRRFLELYAASGVAGSALHCAMSRRPGVGASGALFGLLGALIVCFESRLPRPGGPAAAPRRPHDWRAALGAPDGGPGPGVAARRAAGELDPYLLYLNAVGGIGLSIVLFPILGFWAHVGGLAGGGLCMFALLEPRGRDAVSAAAMRGRASVAARELWRRCRNAIEQITGL